MGEVWRGGGDREGLGFKLGNEGNVGIVWDSIWVMLGRKLGNARRKYRGYGRDIWEG